MMQLASNLGALGGEGKDGAREVDVKLIIDSWSEEIPMFIDGHLSHLLPVDAVIILRCHPTELERRLKERGYASEKIQANVEYEMIGGPWADLIDEERPILELDNTTFEAHIEDWLEKGCPPRSKAIGAIDWLSLL